ncbi:MAG: phosphoribosyltransferase [Candidatus Omnitrophica bacterium]|nr:phosphoribosyltransferase [Candidatus Omnitrophota bacterium]MDD5487826.1 phosphoribosyltransferase [Candidatus Omnitrophota bacterium]
MKSIPLNVISERISKVAVERPDMVIGILEGGRTMADLIAKKMGCRVGYVRISFRDATNTPVYEAPTLIGPFEDIPERMKKILLVDDVSVTGKTLKAAKDLLPGKEIITMVLKGEADMVVFPEIRECVVWPWTSVSAT